MNWLAHAWLAGPDPESRLGNLLADLTKGEDRAGLAPGVLRGIAHHQSIDAFTDKHPVVLQSRRRIDADYRRYSGILVDIFYDHILANEWERYSDMPLTAFTAQLYDDIAPLLPSVPSVQRHHLERLIEWDILAAYRDLDGVEHALRQISQRLNARRPGVVVLEASLPQLVDHYADLSADFAEFFPQLDEHAQSSLLLPGQTARHLPR
ncbi:MAG TPA: ACP phosphodiesterase [Moraxellaceae bacterium]|nr:ACP phosphodiesterase [Moraxellaceae bacterium]